MTTALVIFVVIAAVFVAVAQFLVKLDDTGVLGIFRSRARRPQLILVGIELALVLLAAAMMSITSRWTAIAWKVTGIFLAFVMLMTVRTIRRNLARRSKPATPPAPAVPPTPPEQPI